MSRNLDRRTQAVARGVSDGAAPPGGPVSADGHSSGPAAGRGGAQPGAMVALHGEVTLDGRKMGRIVAVGQTSAASLPTVSASAINLRALPVFAGTSAPL